MFFPKENDEEGIISKEKPTFSKEKRKFELQKGIKQKEYSEVSNFLKEYYTIENVRTFLPVSELRKYNRFSSLFLLMRAPNLELIGTILSIPFPISCRYKEKGETIIHGATSFLNLHPKIRKLGLTKTLIRELTVYGFEKNVLCSYMTTNFPLTEKSIEIESWYRPLNLQNSIALGFSFPDWNKPSVFAQERIKFGTKLPKKYKTKIVKDNNMETAFQFYQKVNQNKKFVFYPDLAFFNKFVKEYPSYLVYKEKKIVGFFTLGIIYMKTEFGMEAEIATPLLFNGIKGEEANSLRVCISTAREKEFDVLYLHSIGDITKEVLEEVYAIKTFSNSYFSLYNNSMDLKKSDLYVPLF